MAQLTIKLRDGFRRDHVTIRVNDREIYRKPDVSTDLTISFADAVDAELDESEVRLDVAVAGKQSASADIRVDATPFVDITIVNEIIQIRPSASEIPML